MDKKPTSVSKNEDYVQHEVIPRCMHIDTCFNKQLDHDVVFFPVSQDDGNFESSYCKSSVLFKTGEDLVIIGEAN